MKIMIFAGSIRSGSFNGQLAHAANSVLAEMGAETTFVSLGDYPMPIYDDDLKAEKGIPDNVTKLAKLLAAQDGLFIASPEYNASITPLLKNAIDWMSVIRTDPKPFPGLVVALGSASPGGLGGIRGLYHLRAVLMNVEAQIITEQCAVSRASGAFGDDGLPTDERTLSMLRATCRSLMEIAVSGRGRG
ncbi:MAG: NAD(P)H-dependent oxidoreductase [Pseudomonadota bacterium]